MTSPPVTEQSHIGYNLEELGDLIRFRRSVLQLNRAEASARVGVSIYVMSRLENGKAVRTGSLVKVFQGLGLAITARLVNRTDFMLPPLDETQVSESSVSDIEPSKN